MSDAIVAEFVEQLAELARTFAGRPKAELEALWLIGLEREAIVTVAYRSGVIDDRLRRMQVDDEARAVIARAIRWAWRDEKAHTLWVRGALLRTGDAPTRARALQAQLEGLVGGWVSSRQNHLGWREAPVQRFVAEALETAAALGGRIPSAVRDTLHWNTFAEFCRFNRAAETTAAMAWRRMAALAGGVGDHLEAEGFAWMATDEERHARVFATLIEAFDRDDRLLVPVEVLRARLLEVGERFVARPEVADPAWPDPLGKGGTVVVREGEDARAVVGGVLERCGIAELLDARRPVDRPIVVALKTTFMLVTDRRDRSPGVSLPVLRATVAWLREHGAIVKLIDARNLYDVFHAGRGVAEVATYLGLGEPVIDAQAEQEAHAYARGGAVHTASRTWRDADVRLLLGKLRSHPTTGALLSLEAAEGLAVRPDDHLFADRRADRETALLMTLDALPPHAALLDAWADVPDGLLGVFGGARPLQPRRIYGALDAVALDAVACRHTGAECGLVAEAFDWFGDPRPRTSVDGVDTPIAGFRLPDHSARTALLAELARPVFTHASLRGALFLPRFDESAFPPITPPSATLQAARAAVRWIVEDRAARPGDDDEPLPTTMLQVGRQTVRVARLGAGPPVVLLHGYPETLQIWSRVARRLASRHEVIAFDWPGLGHSSPCEGTADPDALAGQLGAVLDAARLGTVDLVGADMGGPPALVFAARHPDRVGRVVVTSSLLFGDAATSLEIRLMRRAGLASAAFRFAPGLVYARCKATFLPDDEALPAAIDDDFASAFHRPEVRARLARMCADYERALPGLPERYWTIRRPVRLLWAEADHHFPPDQARRFCELLPEARLTVVPDARHWMAMSRAPEVAEHIAAWLA